MASTIKYIIEKQPKLFKKFLYKTIPFEYRYGKKYLEFLDLIEKSKKWSYDQTVDYQTKKLKELLKYSYNNVPYYTNLFNEIGFNTDINYLDDIESIPLLTKDIIIDNFDSMISTSFNGRKYKMYTSGTTGKRLTILGSDDLFKIESAFITKAFNDHGAKLYKDHSIWIRRYSPQKDDPIFFKDHELNRTYMSPFHLNDETIKSYVDYINSTKSVILVSYPSTIYYLSLLCEKHGLKLKYVKQIHGASEVCLPQWYTKIKEVFGFDIKMHYGQVEKVSFAHQDNENRMYKENLLYSFNEFSEDGNIIGTGFYNQVMPLIRYKTNDKVDLVVNPSLTSSSPKTIKDVLGRNGDMLITDKDSLVPAVNFYSFMSKYVEVDLFKIVQKKETKELDFFIVKNELYNNDTEKKLIDEMVYRLGNISINIKHVSTINRDENSPKFKAINLI